MAPRLSESPKSFLCSRRLGAKGDGALLQSVIAFYETDELQVPRRDVL